MLVLVILTQLLNRKSRPRLIRMTCAAALLMILACQSPDDTAATTEVSAATTTATGAATSSSTSLPGNESTASTAAATSTTSTTAIVTTSTSIVSTTTQPDNSGDGIFGLVGCSTTRDAVDGYVALGGNLVWDLDDQYAGGSIDRWSTADSRKWQDFERLLAANGYPGRLWWQLCTGGENVPTIETARAVLAEIHRRLPGVPIYASAQPGYADGHVCRMAGADGPQMMSDFVEILVNSGEVNAGPTIGPLSKAQTKDGCHANEAGQALMGGQLADFIASIGS